MEKAELSEILVWIEAIRSEARSNGDYNKSIKDYERILKLSMQLPPKTDSSFADKFKHLRESLQKELKILYSIRKELQDVSVFKITNQHGSDGSNEQVQNDPDVWLPPSQQPAQNQFVHRPVKRTTPPPLSSANRVPAHRPLQVSADAKERDNRPKLVGDRNPGLGKAPTPSAPSRVPVKPALNNGVVKKSGAKAEISEFDENGALKKYSELQKERGCVDIQLIEGIERDIVDNKVHVTWESIAGLEPVKALLREVVVWPLWMPDYFKGIRRPWKGVLLFGPPGTGGHQMLLRN